MDKRQKQESGDIISAFQILPKIKTSCLIVGEMSSSKCNVTVEEYRYRKIMHAEKNGRHLNEKIKPNPDRSDPNPVYIAKRIRHDEKKNFAKNHCRGCIRANEKVAPPNLSICSIVSIETRYLSRL